MSHRRLLRGYLVVSLAGSMFLWASSDHRAVAHSAMAAVVQTMPFRLSDARLSIDAEYRPPWNGPPRKLARYAWDEPLLRTLAAQTDVSKGDAVQALHVQGLARLLIGNPDDAVGSFRLALAHARAANLPGPKMAALWNDAAVAHEQSGSRGDAVNFVIALDYAERAWRIHHSAATAWTRAILAERLNLEHAAAIAWNDYRDLDPHSSWTAEESRRITSRQLRSLELAVGRSDRKRGAEERGFRARDMGVKSAMAGDFRRSVKEFGDALAASEDAENAALVLILRAEALDRVSAMDEGWVDRMAALRLVGRAGTDGRALTLISTARSAIRDGHDYAADLVLAEIESEARSRNDGVRLAEAGMWRTMVRSRIGDPFVQGDLDNVKLTVPTDARAAAVAAPVAPAALELSRQTDHRTAEIEFASAEANFLAALSGLQQQARDASDPLMRTLFAERARSLLLLASEVQIGRGRPEAALWFSDRARQVAFETFADALPPDAGPWTDPELRGSDLARRTPAGVTILYQDVQSDRLLTWVLRDGRIHFVSTEVSGASLLAEAEQFRADLVSNTAPVNEAKALYGVLLKPVSELIAGDGLLVYSPPPALRGFPIAALHDGARFLIETRPIVITRSIGEYLARPRTPETYRTALVVLPSPGPGSLPLRGAQFESISIAGMYGRRATSLIGDDATPSALFASAQTADVIHIGTHGSADRRPLHNAIEFGPVKLRVYDVLSIHLPRSPLVVLAGCRTDDETEGRPMLSLASSFVAAGAGAVVGSLWNVEDDETARLMIDFHRELLHGASAADALRDAQRLAMARHADISTWAAFQLQM